MCVTVGVCSGNLIFDLLDLYALSKQRKARKTIPTEDARHTRMSHAVALVTVGVNVVDCDADDDRFHVIQRDCRDCRHSLFPEEAQMVRPD